MAYGTRRYRRSYSRKAGTRFRRIPRYYRGLSRTTGYRYRRRRSATAKTVSKTVKLSMDTTVNLVANGQPVPAYSFSLNELPGFNDYFGVYSHFRVKKAVLTMTRSSLTNSSQTAIDNCDMANYLVVPSRSYASSRNPWTGTTADMNRNSGPPAVQEADLRQSRWQKVLYPSTTRQSIRVGFYPYTMVGTFGPTFTLGDGDASGGKYTNPIYQRVWNGTKWTPYTWSHALSTNTPGDPNNTVTYFGPYIMRQGEGSSLTFSAAATLVVYLQFKGQI